MNIPCLLSSSIGFIAMIASVTTALTPVSPDSHLRPFYLLPSLCLHRFSIGFIAMPSNTGNWLVSTCPACQTPLHSTAYSLPSLVQDSSVSLLLLLPWPRLLLDVSVYHCNHIAAGTAYCGYEQHFTAVYCLKNNSWGISIFFTSVFTSDPQLLNSAV